MPHDKLLMDSSLRKVVVICHCPIGETYHKVAFHMATWVVCFMRVRIATCQAHTIRCYAVQKFLFDSYHLAKPFLPSSATRSNDHCPPKYCLAKSPSPSCAKHSNDLLFFSSRLAIRFPPPSATPITSFTGLSNAEHMSIIHTMTTTYCTMLCDIQIIHYEVSLLPICLIIIDL